MNAPFFRPHNRPALSALLASSVLALAACGVLPSGKAPPPATSQTPQPKDTKLGAGEAAPGAPASSAAVASTRAHDVTIFALGLMETGYRFGGKNPAAGLDCSGMISYVFDKAAGIKLAGSAAQIASRGRPVDSAQLRPGDLVFFNTRNKPYSHVGIYIGDDRFVHAPNSRGKVRTESLKSGWFAARFEEARTYFD